MVKDDVLSVWGVMEEFESDGWGADVRLEKYLLAMMKLPSSWFMVLFHRQLI